MAKPIPDGYQAVTPYLIVDDAAGAIDFYKQAFSATERYRLPMGDRIGHAEIMIGTSVVMLADESPASEAYSPNHYQGSPVSLLLYVKDVDSFAEQAVAAGITILRPIQNQFYGDRSGMFLDPYGYRWTIATHVEDVSPQEMQKRMAKAAPQG